MSRPAIARININHLQHNYRLLQQCAGHSEIMAIVKADAYGHGLALVAPALFAAGGRHFGVTDAAEGYALRQYLDSEEHVEITLLSGIFDAEDARLATQHRLTPAITESAQLKLLQQADFHAQAWIKVDSGMHRLGSNDPAMLCRQCNKQGIKVRGIMSHLACADMPEHPLNRRQLLSFQKLRNQTGEDLPASLLNSAGMVMMPKQGMDVVRPGIALYGSEPIADQPFGFKPVMQFTGAVMQIREIPAGAQISYGATFRADRAMRIAVVSLGYGDGLPRALGNRGEAFFDGRKLPVVGRVCMDYTMLDITDIDIHPGDAVEFWGDHIPAADVARSLDTISYTLFTGVSRRVQRMAM